jgi:hypothetical protein
MLPSGDFFTQTNVMVPTAITVSPRTTVNSYSIERVFCRGEHVGPNPAAAMVFVRSMTSTEVLIDENSLAWQQGQAMDSQ